MFFWELREEGYCAMNILMGSEKNENGLLGLGCLK